MTIKDAKGSRAIKARGRQFENDVVEVFKANGFPDAERRRQRGINDAGDIAGVPMLVIECKNEKRINLAGYMAELEREAGACFGVVTVKRRGKGADQAYVVMDLEQFVRIWEDFSRCSG